MHYRDIERFRKHLIEQEKSAATIEKYIRDVAAFFKWLKNRDAEKTVVIEYKKCIAKTYKTASVNSMLSSLNSFFAFAGQPELRVKTIKTQRAAFAPREKELTKAEYKRLIETAEKQGKRRLSCMMRTMCSTGIRVSELKYITVEAINRTFAEVRSKGKTRRVILPQALCRMLRRYARQNGIRRGSIFITKTGRPIGRENVWSEMKKLCKAAKVERSKVFPHNLRHLFAVQFYSLGKDIVRLADVLGHSSINTTRIYTIESGDTHRRMIEKMDLVGVRVE